MNFFSMKSRKSEAKALRPGVPAGGAAAWLVVSGVLMLGVSGCKKSHSVSQAVSRTANQSPHQTGSQLDFNQDVQPVLASNCFSCHGPDPAARKAGLRLDLEETALRKRPGKPDAIVSGHPELSELIKRVESKNPHQLMPQTSEGEAKPMKPEDIAVLKRWVEEGAHYRPHWAFEDPTRPDSPAVKQADWAKTPIDRFVQARLAREGLQPSPEANKPTLIRRVTLDLTGLLPTPKEVAAFEQDASPQAYEHVVDRLLASSAYGEQRARYWMDYARYSDTYGLHYDNNHHLWPYRDYVIRAFNNNKPFDQFAKEQIAGDMMPAKDLDPIIASGYVRAGVSSNEGGTIAEELRFNVARERAEAYGAAFMGLTVGCAVCHDHKYDPTTQKDFYQLTAFFNNIDELPFNGDRPDWAPVVRIPKADKLAAYNQVLAKRTELAAQLRAERLQEAAMVERWIKTGQQQPLSVSSEALVLRLRLDEQGGDTLRNSAPHASQASFPIGKVKPQWGETTWLWQDFRMDTNTHVMLGQAGDFDTKQAFSGGGWFMVRSAPNSMAATVSGALISRMDSTQKNRGWDLATDQGIISVDIVNAATQLEPGPDKNASKAPPTAPKLDLVTAVPHKPVAVRWPVINGRALRVSTAVPVVKEGQWQHIFFTYDGSGKASGVRIFVDGAAVAVKTVSDTLAGSTIRTQAPLQLGWRYPEATPAKNTRYQDVRLYARTLSPEEAKRLPYEDYAAELVHKSPNQWSGDELHAASSFYFSNVDKAAMSVQEQIRQCDTDLAKLSDGGDLDIVSQEKPSIAYAHILSRGIYTARTERVEANTPHFLPPIPTGQPHDRLALANWTVSANNPLTARVTVNRMWNEVFGTGLVETTEDFGIMGGRPSNPQLLDWLSVEFRQSGWNVKHMYKLMVMSAAYRQSSKTTPEGLAKDPRNLLLARGPRFRMDAEMLRDIALQSSGLLVPRVGGPSVRTYQPQRVWESVGIPQSDTTSYVQDHGDALYRRSLYTYWKRMAMQPDMDAFDAPTRDTVCTRRQRTDTPLQALVTMNDVQWIEASRMLAERAIRESGKQPDQRFQFLSEILLSHDLPPRTETVLRQSLKQMEAHYSADPKAAMQLVAVGEKSRNPSIPATELAAWTMVVSEMMNLDETLNK